MTRTLTEYFDAIDRCTPDGAHLALAGCENRKPDSDDENCDNCEACKNEIDHSVYECDVCWTSAHGKRNSMAWVSGEFPNVEVIHIAACDDCTLLHCNGDLPEYMEDDRELTGRHL